MLLADRVALITGGAGGIGRGIALQFAEEGCAVVIADIQAANTAKTLDEVKEKGVEGLAIQCDATDIRQIKNTVDKVISRFGQIDILVNNAGGMPASPPLEEITDDLWNKVLDLNLKSGFLFCQTVVPYMKEKKYGRIINISSIGAINPPRHSVHYNAAKAGVIGMTYDLAFALAPFNITVNVIVPGLIRTDFYDKLVGLRNETDKNAFFASLAEMVPLKRIGTPEDIAGAALFLASRLGSYVTGTSVFVSGGMPLSSQT